ncbi:MAG: hypothetical protein EPO24_12625 [Bacteroidetes bacterium]|nr:MAG: hypothetical protein EPO24_12625 [Bacteroidota bacterium]
MKFAKYVFLTAGIYGIIVILPMYFMEAQTGIDYPPAITHPEFYYGFIGVTLAWQIAFLVIGKDPVRFRLLMIPSMFEKFLYVIAIAVLLLQQRVPSISGLFAFIDCALGILFLISFIKTKNPAQ